MLSNCNIDTHNNPASHKVRGYFLTLAALLILSVPGYCQDNSGNHATKTIEGTISSLDWVGSTIAVNGIMLYVPSNADIHKGANQIGLDAIHIGDPVTVMYYDESPGVHKAVAIEVQCNGDCPV